MSTSSDWQYLLDSVGRDALIDYYENSQLYGVGYWAGTPHGTNIYQGLHDDIFPNLNPTVHEKYLFLDFSDLKKKTLDEIAELPALLQGFEDYLHVVLLMNDNEFDGFPSSVNREYRNLSPMFLLMPRCKILRPSLPKYTKSVELPLLPIIPPDLQHWPAPKEFNKS